MICVKHVDIHPALLLLSQNDVHDFVLPVLGIDLKGD